MPQAILFLCTGNYYRSRFAEVVFNAAAARMGLGWRAASRGLAVELGTGNVGPMAKEALQLLAKMNVRDLMATAREWAAQLAKSAPLALQTVKEVLRAIECKPLEDTFTTMRKGDLPTAEARLTVLTRACSTGCEELDDLQKAVSRFKATGKP